MAIEICTETFVTHEKDVLENNAMRLIFEALEEYDCEPWDAGLISNITRTIEEQLNPRGL